MIKKILYQVGIASTIGLGTLIAITPLNLYVKQVLTTPLFQLLGGIGLIATGLWITKNYGKKFSTDG